MDNKALKRLELPKILDKLAGYARTAPGKEHALALRPLSDVETIKKLLAETSEGKMLFRFEPGADMYGWFDIRKSTMRVERGAIVEPLELYEIGETMAASRRIKRFILDRQEKYPLMVNLVAGLESFPDLEREILQSVSPLGEMLDEASPVLFQIRRKSIRLQERIRERLENYIRSPQYIKYLQDPIVTIREGRYVIPVKQEYRGSVPGIIHDQSASGATLFVEPMPVVEGNNEVKRLATEEKQEIARILKSFSARIAAAAEPLKQVVAALGYIDFIMAKANLSVEMDGSAPLISDGAFLKMNRARHPLLKGTVVPVDVHLGKEFTMLVITGPNTGGKTVALKTIGLLVLMAQSGLHIPAQGDSEIGTFKQAFADIGDEQSIEQSLSTFSSHMSNIVEIIDQACPQSLVLLDELGAGTDPAEGSALAQAILGELNDRGVKVIATTHYTELKNYAYMTKGVENASVQFDPRTLRPTYQLLIGKPGFSNAFEIANRLGISANVIQKAKNYLTTEHIKLTEIAERLEREYGDAKEKNTRAQEAMYLAIKDKEKYERLVRELRATRDKTIESAREKARSIVKNSESKAEEIITRLRKDILNGSNREKEEAIKRAREEIKVMKSSVRVRTKRKHHPGTKPLSDVLPGQEVFLPNLNQKGQVLEKSRDDEVLVQVGIMKINVPLREIQGISHKKDVPIAKSTYTGIMANKSQNISLELDLRGNYPYEATAAVEKYLDDASLAGLKRVTLIHGKGTGALRVAVHGFLRKNPRVSSFRLGMQGEGGSGATVVELK